MGLEDGGDGIITNRTEQNKAKFMQLHSQPYSDELRKIYNFDHVKTDFKPLEGQSIYEYIYIMSLHFFRVRFSVMSKQSEKIKRQT